MRGETREIMEKLGLPTLTEEELAVNRVKRELTGRPTEYDLQLLAAIRCHREYYNSVQLGSARDPILLNGELIWPPE